MNFLHKKAYGNKSVVFLLTAVSILFAVSCVSPDIKPTVPEPSSGKTETKSKVTEKEFTAVAFAEKLQLLLAENKIDEALASFDTIPAEYKNDMPLNFLHASLLISAGNLNKAQELASALLDSEPANVDVLFLNSLIAKSQGNTARKNELLKEIIKTDPENSDANAELGNEQMKRRNFPLARTYYAKSLESNPAHFVALIGYGQVSYYLNNLKDSRSAFERAIVLDPQNSLAYAYLAKLEAEENKFPSAVTYIEKALELDSEYYDYWIDYGEYLRRLARNTEALAAWSRAIEIDSNYFLGYVYRGGLHDYLNMYDQAISDYTNIVQLNPSYYYAYETLGILLWREKQWEDCRKAFESAYARNKTNLSYILMISASYLKEKNTAGNKAFLTQALKNIPRDSLDYAIARLYYDNTGENDLILKLSKETNLQKRGKVLYYLALYYQLTDKPTLAEKYFIEVKTTPSPQFFEYRLNDWALEDLDIIF